jgi:hypothetical protein
MGDPLYGKGNKNKDGLKLVAFQLKFEDVDFELPMPLRLF